MIFGFSRANSQSLSVFDIDTTNYPIMKAKFFACDKDGKHVSNITPSDLIVTENGQPRSIIDVSCPLPKPPLDLSVVITMEMSCSMKWSGAQTAYATANAIIERLPTANSECAITSFGRNNYLNQDFTSDKQKLNVSIQCKEPYGGSDFDLAFIKPAAGALLVAEKAKYKKIIFLISDGDANANETVIISMANKINAEIYCLVLENDCPQKLKNIAKNTGGEWFENISSRELAIEIISKILLTVQGQSPCNLEWKSHNICDIDNCILNIEENISKSNFSTNLHLPGKASANLIFQPSGITFIDKQLNIPADTTIQVTAINTNFNVTDIVSKNPAFKITPKSFFLSKGQVKTITIQFTPIDSNYTFTDFNFITDECNSYYFSNARYNDKRIKNPSLTLTHPNGGEKFAINSDTVIKWKGILPEDNVILELSRDNGVSWKTFNFSAKGYIQDWKKITAPPSDSCLMRVTQYSKETKVPHIEWEKNLGGRLWEYPTDIQITSDKGFIIAGYSESSDGDLTGNKGQHDYWIVKTDSVCNIQWQKNLGGKLSEIPNSIKETQDGGYIIVGSTNSNDGDVSRITQSTDYWIVKLDKQGNIQWQKKLGGRFEDCATSVVQADDGG
jgi:hypothetical protein